MALLKQMMVQGAELAYHRVDDLVVRVDGMAGFTLYSWPDAASREGWAPPARWTKWWFPPAGGVTPAACYQALAMRPEFADASADDPVEVAGMALGMAQPVDSMRWDGRQWVDPTYRTMQQIKADAWTRIKAVRAALDAAPITAAGVTVDADPVSVTKIMGAILEMQLNGTPTRRWTLYDNTRADLTLQQLAEIGSAIAARTQWTQDTSQDLRLQIEAATTVESVEAVAWPS